MLNRNHLKTVYSSSISIFQLSLCSQYLSFSSSFIKFLHKVGKSLSRLTAYPAKTLVCLSLTWLESTHFPLLLLPPIPPIPPILPLIPLQHNIHPTIQQLSKKQPTSIPKYLVQRLSLPKSWCDSYLLSVPCIHLMYQINVHYWSKEISRGIFLCMAKNSLYGKN